MNGAGHVAGTLALLAFLLASCGERPPTTEPPTEQPPATTAATPAAPTPGAATPAIPAPGAKPEPDPNRLIAWIEESEPEDGPAPLTVKFLTVVRGGVPPYTYEWNFDDESPSVNEAHPEHTYAEKGLYWPELLVKDAAGNEDDDMTLIDVR